MNFTSFQSQEDEANLVAAHAWEQWTQNGLGLDYEDRRETFKSALDAAWAVYTDGMDELDWLKATVARLRGYETN